MKDDAKHIRSNKEKWDKFTDSFLSKAYLSKFLRNDQRKLLALLDIKKNVHFLDVGCGTGWAVAEAARVASFEGEFYGIDLSPRMIERAKSEFSGRGNFHFLEANAESIPLKDDYFDIIISTNSFHHYLHPDKALTEMHRLLRRGGKLYILDLAADSWIARIADRIIRLVEPEHVKLYSTKEFQQLFENAGLRYAASETIKNSKVHIGEK